MAPHNPGIQPMPHLQDFTGLPCLPRWKWVKLMVPNVLPGPSDNASGSRRTQSPPSASTLPPSGTLELGPFKGTFNDLVVWGTKLLFLGLWNTTGPIFLCQEDAGKSLRSCFTNISFILCIITNMSRSLPSFTKREAGTCTERKGLM